MSENMNNHELSETKNCLICVEAINKKAIKCTKCGSFQNWRRYMDFSPSIVPWTTAIIASSFALIGWISGMIRLPDSRFQSSAEVFYTSTSNDLSVLIGNIGDRPGLVLPSYIYCEEPNGPLGIYGYCPSVVFRPSEGMHIVEAGKIENVRFSMRQLDSDLYYSQDWREMYSSFDHAVSYFVAHHINCFFRITVSNFRSGEEIIIKPINCGIYIHRVMAQAPPQSSSSAPGSPRTSPIIRR